MRLIRSLVLATAMLAVGFTFGGLAPSASADDCGCAPVRSRVTCNRSGTCHVRDRHHPSTRYTIPRHNRGFRSCDGGHTRPAYGPWARMRRGLRYGRRPIHRRHVGHYFLRRHPFALTKGAVLEEAANINTLLAIGDPDAGSERTLDTAGLLDRGTARFHIGDYDNARKDFAALLAKAPKDARARLGLLMVAIVKNDWAAAVGELNTLAAAGELRADDRFAGDSLFADASKLKALTAALTSTSGYRITEAKAHTVTAWLLLAQGEAATARRFVRMAKQWGSSTAALQTLEVNLGMVKAPAPAAAAPKKAPEPSTKGAPDGRAPNPALHREIAAAPRRGA